MKMRLLLLSFPGASRCDAKLSELSLENQTNDHKLYENQITDTI
ncbi:hypothetical protein CLV42_107240 [Chitinophaga ginsengisoli]|uniref:Uncharacterized protein n=1 Tax=Chitinophaga ginsengisoli TaxID=363837 RepID=A0A2P8G541_9BACT|nr:hypothetical protein CLV42_107240 [Chitinophaga ginsengisoli]